MDGSDLDPLGILQQQVESLRLAGVQWLPVTTHAIPASAPAVPMTAAAPRASAPEAPAENQNRLESTQTAAPVLPRAEKIKALTVLNDSQVKGCPRCAVLVKSRTQTVFGVGNPDAELVFVGEAPGADEDAQGEPFVGAAG